MNFRLKLLLVLSTVDTKPEFELENIKAKVRHAIALGPF